MTESEQRAYALLAWVREQIAIDQPQLADVLSDTSLSCVSGDASFRRYYRVSVTGQSWICVDAPPEKEDSSAFVRVAELLSRHDILVPQVISFDLEAGFMLLSDFGDMLFLDTLKSDVDVSMPYQQALGVLLAMQQIPPSETHFLPHYDANQLQMEMDLFEAWFLPEYLQITPSASALRMLRNTYNLLIESALAQPQVFVHRDYHSRNLMWVKGERLGTIDFQDALQGPITYDLVSVLKDCYFQLPESQVRYWSDQYAQNLLKAGLLEQYDPSVWQRWFDWMGIQRHIKVCGIFARLHFRDGKSNYLRDIPLTVRYLIESARRYEPMIPFTLFLEEHVLPALYRVNPEAQTIIAGDRESN